MEEKRGNIFRIFTQGDMFSKLSFVVFGLSNAVRGQVIKGLLFLCLEVVYFVFMARSGIHNLQELMTLGMQEQGMVFNDAIGIYEMRQGDNSMLILLWGVVTLVVTGAFLLLWIGSVRSGETVRQLKENNKPVPKFGDDLRSLLNEKIHLLFLSVPTLGIVVFTIVPLIYMILMAFTNYDAEHQPPGKLFTWVGLANFRALISSTDKLSATFWPILGWTLFWGFVACFSCYFGGMFLAILINHKGIRFKKFWRTIFIMTMAIPAFVSLLVVSTMLGKSGIINVLLQQWGFANGSLPFLTNGTWAKATVIIVNLWIGVPATMLMVSGILMNIPGELYESAQIDGAGPIVTFVKITFPYMLFITTPYLITNLISNFNNFGVIYFLTGGAPGTLDYYKGAGKTDLLVTWLYKLTKDSKDYNLAATIGIVIFLISAVFSLIMYSRSGALKNEEGFQ